MTYPSRHIPRALLLAVVALLALGAGSAAAASSKTKRPAPCWKALINDWYDGRIDGIYPIHCYRDALKHLPTDVDTYSSARDDIKQALQERLTQSRTGGGTKGGSSGSGGTHGTGGIGPTGGGSGTKGDGSGATGGGGSKGGGNGAKGPIGNALNAVRPTHADSVPVPLIVLGGVALLLMAAGGAGFLARRTRLRKLQLASAASLPQTGSEPPPGSPSGR